MTTTLAITPAEWASMQDGTLWLVWEADVGQGGRLCPPAEFVAAATPCTARDHCSDPYNGYVDTTCPDCRIELVAICDTCDGQGGCMYGGSWGNCEPCNASGIIHLGWGYAVGQPTPILPFSPDHDDGPHICVDERPDSWLLRYPGSVEPRHGDDITAALAHYGPPESLVGKWALQVQVTP